MVRRILRTPAWVMLLVFGLSALSPSYAHFRGRCDACAPSETPSRHDLRVGILWVDVLFDSVAGGGRDRDPALCERLLRSAQYENLLLIRKRNIISRGGYTVRPPHQAVRHSAPGMESRLLPFLSFEILHDPDHRHAGGYHSLHAGLSPPSPRSLS